MAPECPLLCSVTHKIILSSSLFPVRRLTDMSVADGHLPATQEVDEILEALMCLKIFSPSLRGRLRPTGDSPPLHSLHRRWELPSK